MKYLCLVYFDPTVFDTMSRADKAALDRDSLAYDRHLQASGHFLAAEALQAAKTAHTVTVRDGRIAITDGPFTETKVPLCGFILIDATDADIAAHLAAGIPLAKLGWIEVRPIYDIPTSPPV